MYVKASGQRLCKLIKAVESLEYCNKLFEIEQHCKEMKPEEGYKYSQEHAKTIVDAFFEWLETFAVAGGSALSKAKACAIGKKKYPIKYLNNHFYVIEFSDLLAVKCQIITHNG